MRADGGKRHWDSSTESSDSFVFRKHGSEACPQTLAGLCDRSKGHHLTVLIVVTIGISALHRQHQTIFMNNSQSCDKA